MESLKIKTHVGADGILKLELPVDVSNVDVELVITMELATSTATPPKPVMSDELKEIARKNGWPDGFFEETYGALADDPIQRWPQGELEVRDEIL